MEHDVSNYLRDRGFHAEIVKRLLDLPREDQDAIGQILLALKIGDNHARDMLDWLEEIVKRDDTRVSTILARETFRRILTDPRLGRNDKLKRVKEELRRLRFPRLSGIEGQIAKKIQTLKLNPRIQMAVPSGLEGGFLTVQLKALSQAELRRLASELAQAAEKQELQEVFELLDGRRIPGEDK